MRIAFRISEWASQDPSCIRFPPSQRQQKAEALARENNPRVAETLAPSPGSRNLGSKRVRDMEEEEEGEIAMESSGAGSPGSGSEKRRRSANSLHHLLQMCQT